MSAFKIFLAAIIAVPTTANAADLVLLDPANPPAADRMTAQDTTLTFSREKLDVQTGGTKPWPGFTLLAPKTYLDLTPYDAVDITLRNLDTQKLGIWGRVDNPGAEGTDRNLAGNLSLAPGESGVLRLQLKRATSSDMGGWLFGMRGYPTAPGGPGTINPAFVTAIKLFLATAKPDGPRHFAVESIRAVGSYHGPTASLSDADPYFPFIDTFGQYKHKDWPGKTHSLADLSARKESETADLKANAGNETWDRYGGWKNGPQLTASGFFRTQKQDGKWWLVDPDGHLFFSTGLDCIRLPDPTGIADREQWFDNYPGDTPEFNEFSTEKGSATKGYYATRNPRSFWFAGANLKRKYGANWRDATADLDQARMRSWGFNTIGMWSDGALTAPAAPRGTPYVTYFYTHARTIAGSDGFWGKFPDPFDPQFAASAAKGAAGLKAKGAGDPWCLGVFVDNELSWGEANGLGDAALHSPKDQPAKIAFVADLRQKYGEIGTLNTAWAADYASWDALLAANAGPDKAKPSSNANAAMAADLGAFSTHIAEEYFRTVHDAIKAVAPNQLYLGCRFSLIAENARASAAAAKYCDVVSYNVYKKHVGDFVYDGGADVPLLVGEFHFGALDRGLFHPGIVQLANQAERGQAFQDFVTSALQDPRYVGCHWFEFNDEATTGRVWDGENFQIGFVDVTDTPYPEMVAASRAVTKNMYAVRAATK